MELLLELLPDPELGYEGTGTGGAGGGKRPVFFNACALGRVDIFEGEPAKLDRHRGRIKEDGE